MIKCPNCKKLYEFQDSEDAYYAISLIHKNPSCPYGIEIYHHTQEEAKESAREHILKKFPWMTKDSIYLEG